MHRCVFEADLAKDMDQKNETELFTMTKPDDWHLHLRDGSIMSKVLSHSARHFGRAIIMPNLDPPIAKLKEARDYHKRICKALEPDSSFQALMTLYLTEELTKEELRRAKESSLIYGVKLYPAGATSYSQWGLNDIESFYPIFAEMERLRLPLLIHAEVTDPEVDVFDREKVFIERHLEAMTKEFKELKIVFEHITSSEAVDFVESASSCLGATITAHHLLWSRNALFEKGIRPHRYCLPLLKTEKDRQALLKAATSGQSKFFLGTDSAPHLRSQKENSCGCAGIYSAPCALALYAQIFSEQGALDRLEAFASLHGAAFYGLEPNSDTITLAKKKNTLAEEYKVGAETLVPLLAGQSLEWSIL